MLDVEYWTSLAFDFELGGLSFHKEAGAPDYEIDNCMYELDADDRPDPQAILILALMRGEKLTTPCTHCDGTGDIDNGDHSCMTCGGAGSNPLLLV